MSVRSLDILDLPSLFRNQDTILPLDSGRFLTHGNPLGANALLSYLNPLRHTYTAVSSETDMSLIGQITLETGETSAHITFLAPEENANGLTVALIEALADQAGRWRAYHLLAEVNEDSPVFKSLRQACLAVYAWQRVWRLPELKHTGENTLWRDARRLDWPAVQALHAQIVPALIQPVDGLPGQPSGMVCRSAEGLQAYVKVNKGPRGVWLLPLVPPESGCVSENLGGLIRLVNGGNDRPVYLCVRSYQAWLEPVLEDLGAEPGPRQAVMVKRLVGTVKEIETAPAMEKSLAKVKPAAPISRIERKNSFGKE